MKSLIKSLSSRTLNDEISRTITSFLFPSHKSYSEDSLTKLSVESFDEKAMSPASELDPISEFNDNISFKYEKLKEIESFKNQIHEEKILIKDAFERNCHKQLKDFENDLPSKCDENKTPTLKKEQKAQSRNEMEEGMMFERSKKEQDKGPQPLIAQQSFTKLQMLSDEVSQNFSNTTLSDILDNSNRGVENERSGEVVSQKSSWSKFSDEFEEGKEEKSAKSAHNTNVLKRFDKKVVKNTKISSQKDLKWAKTSKCFSHNQTYPQKTSNIKDDKTFQTKKSSCELDATSYIDECQQSKSEKTLKIRTIPIDRYTGDIPKTFIAAKNLNITKKKKHTTETRAINDELKASKSTIENFGDGRNTASKINCSFATPNNFIDKVCYESMKDKEKTFESANKDRKSDNESDDYKGRNTDYNVSEEEDQGSKKTKIDNIEDEKKQDGNIFEVSKIEEQICSNDKIPSWMEHTKSSKCCDQQEDTSKSSGTLRDLLSALKNAEKEHEKIKVNNSNASFETKLKFVESMKSNLMRKRIAEGRPANTRVSFNAVQTALYHNHFQEYINLLKTSFKKYNDVY